jgi:hypothetical protein
MSDPRAELTATARRVVRARALAWALAAVGIGAGAGGLAAWFFGNPAAGIPSLGAALLAFGAIAWLDHRQRPVGPREVARHLDRAAPELEESATLLLATPESLGPLARLQRARVAQRLAARPLATVLPPSPLRWATVVGTGGVLIGAGLLVAGTRSGAAGGEATAAPYTTWATLAVGAVAFDVKPQAYTGLRPHRATGPEVEAAEGSTVTLSAEIRGYPQTAWVLFTSGDSTPLEAAGHGRWSAAFTAARSTLVQVRALDRDGAVATSDDYRITVRPDRPPVLVIVKPEPRVEFAAGQRPKAAVKVLANDDYGVDSVYIAATLTSGRGEAVTFRRLTLPFTSRERRRDGGLVLATHIDLARHGLAEGDELYFTVEATDRRAPLPNRARSETVVLSIRDTSSVVTAEASKLALNAEPEYFRSQRQIIIDTERLLEERRRLAKAVFKARSNDLGIDQGLLRLRYGQFLGEEFEEEVPASGREHAAEDQPADLTEEAADSAAADPSSPYRHEHDVAENATLLALSVKEKLKLAVGAMWQAELHLRTGAPKQALPFEYRALELIKMVQQDARVYVQRVGFEPPPIDIAGKRLTGKLKDIRSRGITATTEIEDSLAPLRDAIAAVRRAAERPERADRNELEAAGRGVARLAVDDPRLLAALRHMRRLVASLDHGPFCDPCAREAQRALWAVLPAPLPAPEPVAARMESPVSRRFARLLERSSP